MKRKQPKGSRPTRTNPRPQPAAPKPSKRWAPPGRPSSILEALSIGTLQDCAITAIIYRLYPEVVRAKMPEYDPAVSKDMQQLYRLLSPIAQEMCRELDREVKRLDLLPLSPEQRTAIEETMRTPGAFLQALGLPPLS